MTTAQTILEQVEANIVNGQTFIQWRKQIVADNGAVLFAEAHRTSLEPAHYALDIKGNPIVDGAGNPILVPASDIAHQIAAVDAHLIALGFPATSPSDKGVIASHDAGRLAVVPVKPVVAK